MKIIHFMKEGELASRAIVNILFKRKHGMIIRIRWGKE